MDDDTGPTRPIRWKTLLTIGAALIAVTASAVGYWVLTRGESEQDNIKRVVRDFATAVDTVNSPRMTDLLCREEAAGLTRTDKQSVAQDRVVDAKPRPITVSHIQISGKTADVVVSRPSQKDAHLYLRKEGGAWKICAPAERKPAPAPTGTP